MAWIILILAALVAVLFWELHRTKRALGSLSKMHEALLWTLYSAQTKNANEGVFSWKDYSGSIRIALGEAMPENWSEPEVKDMYLKIFGPEMVEEIPRRILTGKS